MKEFVRKGYEDVKFFVGPEIEHTPAFSKKTLFVVGKQPVEQIKKVAREHSVAHIYFGTSHTFSAADPDPYWNAAITEFLDRGYWVTLDYQAHEHDDVLGMLTPGVWQCRNFVPLLSVRIPKVQTSSPNLTVKIDDSNFNATNPGVWCLHFRELTDSNRFTDWNEYEGDVIIKEEVEEVIPMSNRRFDVDALIREEAKETKNDQLVGLDETGSVFTDTTDQTVIEPTIDNVIESYVEETVPVVQEKVKKTKVKKEE